MVLGALLLAAAGGLAGCAGPGIAVGAGATAGVVAYQERSTAAAAKDFKIESEVLEKWIVFEHSLPTKVSVESYEGRVLLTGIVADEGVRADAVRLAWKVPGVRDLYNEIQINPESGLLDVANDAWITTKLKSTITLDRDVMAINYAIETVGGIIYLIGIAQNQAELDRVIGHARNISYVRRVVDHVRLKGAR